MSRRENFVQNKKCLPKNQLEILMENKKQKCNCKIKTTVNDSKGEYKEIYKLGSKNRMKLISIYKYYIQTK